ncbi:hypothetical protein T11_12630 [Trichinella zimbabwensis]|uniref:Uncharacterized protein n=1 Tax=Trichinella zimbabwensis TaxID=268475 RepID=A0A0V1GXB7_9BILA|nr:hypothetical protein T11_12630 [Trichinella zimbabwensis]
MMSSSSSVLRNDFSQIVKRKETLRTGGWSTAAPVPRFQTLAPDWSTGPDMFGNAEYPLSC